MSATRTNDPPCTVRAAGEGKKAPGTPLTILIDTREQTPLSMPRGFLSERTKLNTGDYSIKGFERSFAVERKSLQDLVQTIIRERERFEYELLRLMQYQFKRVLVEASYDAVAEVESYDFCLVNPKSIVASVNAFEVRYGVPFIFAGTRLKASKMLCNWATFFVRESIKPKGW